MKNDALKYASKGWPVFPLIAGHKQPATSNGFKNASTSAFEVERWWSDYPEANIGVACGGLFVVVDVDQHNGVDGSRGLAALEDVHGALPETLTSKTGGGGEHRFFKHPGGDMKSRSLARGVDIKTDGGYVVLPPSALLKGGEYEWLNDLDIAELPDTWVEAVRRPTARERLTQRSHIATQTNSSELYVRNYVDVATPYGEAALRGEIERMTEAPRGERNSTLNRVAYALGQLIGGGELPEQQARDTLAAAAWAAYQGEDDPGEIDGTLNSGLLAGMDNPRSASRSGSTPYFGGRSGDEFIPAILGRIIKDEGRVLLGHDDRLYKYERGVYLPNGDNYVTARAADELGDRYHRSYVSEVLAWMRSTYATIGTSQPSLKTLNVANGLLDWEAGGLDPHTPTFLSTAQIPVAWDPDATCPVVSQFLADVLPDDAVPFVLEIIGYALYADNPFAKAVQLLGPGGNGKSKLLHLVRSLCGPKNVASVPLQAFGENRFAAASLFGKLANICGDLDARAIKRTDMFKMITGGDPIHAEHKYLHPFTFTSYALPIFSANEPPISSDQSDAWFDRWLVIPLERRFRGTNDDDPFIGTKITAPNELEGLLVLAVEGLRRLIARGGFDLPASVIAAGEGYRERLDTVRGFVAEECVQDVAATADRGGLYRAYKQWCEDSGRYPLSAGQFNAHLRGMGFPEARSNRSGRIWRGLTLHAPPNPLGI